MPLSNYLPSFVTRLFTTGPIEPQVLANPVSEVSGPQEPRDLVERGAARRQPVVSGGRNAALLRAPGGTSSVSVSAPAVPAYYPALEDLLVIKSVERDTTLRGIELRFYDPRGIIAAYALDPSYSDVSCKDLFAHLLRTKNFGPSCGETSNALKSVLFSGTTTEHEGEAALYQAIRAPGDGFLRVQIGCHSFMIEKKDDTCRIFQSYDGWYSMAASLKDDKPIAKNEFARLVQSVVRKDQASSQAEYDAAERAEQRLFHGEVDATRNAKGSNRYQIVTETTDVRTPTSALGGRMDALLDGNNDVWSAFENESRVSVGEFARSRWPELFGL